MSDASSVAAAAAENGDTPQLTAAQRLAQSRERMRQWMLYGDARQDARRRVAEARAEGEQPTWPDRLRSLPVLGLIIDAASSWWANHPLNAVASLSSDAIAPTVRKHPFVALTIAVAAGAALVRWRPWRWVANPALLGGMASELASHVFSQVPLDSLLGAFGSFAQSDPEQQPPEAEGTGAAGNDDESPYIADSAMPSEVNARLAREEALSP